MIFFLEQADYCGADFQSGTFPAGMNRGNNFFNAVDNKYRHAIRGFDANGQILAGGDNGVIIQRFSRREIIAIRFNDKYIVAVNLI